MKPVNYLILLVLPALIVGGYYLGGWFNFLVIICSFLAFPVANLFLSSSENYAHQEHTHSSVHKNIALVFVPILVGLTAWCVYDAGATSMSVIAFAGLGVSLGLVNSIIGFTLAHEFIHRYSKKEKLAGYILLLQNNYMHYGIEHVYGHHVYACTPADPHTARAGESVYAFLPRAIIHTYTNAIAIERKRLMRKNYKMPLIHNRIVWFGILQVLLMLIIFFLFNITALLFFVLQNIVAIALLHIINYMQHYGLMRHKSETGRYEKLDAHHAWNTGKNTSLSIFHLENHADHHMHPDKSFDKLKHTNDSPEHPAGYSFMVLLSLVPPLWFRIMNKRISSNLK